MVDDNNLDVSFSNIIINPTPLQTNTDISKADELVFVRVDQFNKLKELTTIENIKYITGYPGTGKSTITKLFLQKIDSLNNSIIYIDCRIFDNPTKLFEKVYNELATLYPMILNYKDHGIGISEVIKKLNKPTYLVLDEVDKLVNKSGDKRKDLCIHFFCRSTSDNPNSLFKFIFITNQIGFEDNLEPEVMQMISGNKISFGVYDVPELTNILKRRADKALRKGSYREEDLFKIAKEVYMEFDSNSREAINLLKLAIKHSTDKLSYNSIEVATKDLKDQKIIQDLKGFPRGTIVFLRAIVDWLINKGNEEKAEIRWFVFSDIKPNYDKLCTDLNTTPKSLKWLYEYLKELINIKVIGITVQREGKRKIYELLMEPHRLSTQLAKVI